MERTDAASPKLFISCSMAGGIISLSKSYLISSCVFSSTKLSPTISPSFAMTLNATASSTAMYRKKDHLIVSNSGLCRYACNTATSGGCQVNHTTKNRNLAQRAKVSTSCTNIVRYPITYPNGYTPGSPNRTRVDIVYVRGKCSFAEACLNDGIGRIPTVTIHEAIFSSGNADRFSYEVHLF